MTRDPVAASSILFGLLALAGCSGVQPGRPLDSPRFGGSFKLVYQNPPETLDPQRIIYRADWEAASLVFEGLVGHGNSATEVRPLLAESWEELDGGRRWIFKLRAGVHFQDDPSFPGGRGRRVSAKDVLYTLERIARPQTESANAYLFQGRIQGFDDFRAGRATAISGVTALDDRRVEIRLTKPYATFLKTLASQTACIVPREAVEYYGTGFGNHPVGTGPFRLVRWTPFEQILLVRNRNYWRHDARGARLPYLDSIEIRFRTESVETAAYTDFSRGQTYLFVAQQPLYNRLRADPPAARKFQLVGTLPPASLRFLGFSLDTGSPLARHAELRRAVAMSFDRTRLQKQLPQLNVVLADTLAPSQLLGRSLPWHAHDPERARAVFGEYRKELERSPPILGCNFRSEDLVLLRQDLARLSVRTTMQIRPARYYQYILEERPSIFRVSFVPSFFDPEDYYCLFYSKSPRDVNLTGYKSADYDRILEAAMVELDPPRRAALFMRLEEILRRDVPAIYVSQDAPSYVLASPAVRGMALRFVCPDFTEAWLAENHDARP